MSFEVSDSVVVVLSREIHNSGDCQKTLSMILPCLEDILSEIHYPVLPEWYWERPTLVHLSHSGTIYFNSVHNRQPFVISRRILNHHAEFELFCAVSNLAVASSTANPLWEHQLSKFVRQPLQRFLAVYTALDSTHLHVEFALQIDESIRSRILVISIKILLYAAIMDSTMVCLWQQHNQSIGWSSKWAEIFQATLRLPILRIRESDF